MKLKLVLPFLISLAFLSFGYASTITVEITATVPGCGDGAIGVGEQCDGNNLGGSSCSTLGFSGGTLACTSVCTFTTSQCTSGGIGGGGGGGGGGSPSIPLTNVVFTGRAYPRSVVTLLKDAQVVATTVAGADAQFQVTISGISGGSYIFSMYSEDTKGNRSSLLSFPVSITANVTTKVSGIFIAPSITTDKSEVKQGDTITIFGQSAPRSEVTININSEQEFFLKRNTDESGAYLLVFDSSSLEKGDHSARAKASLGEEITTFGKVASFIVGDKNISRQPEKKEVVEARGDLNNDKRVSLIDFSVAAFWYKRANPPAAADFNSDGKVDLVDLSIMAFNWTG